MKKMRRTGSYLSMENLEVDGNSSVSNDGDDKDEKTKNEEFSGLKFDNESITLHPIYILGQSFQKV